MKKDRQPKWPDELIAKISLLDLILLALYSLEEAGEKNCSFEKLLAECYQAFPQRFGLAQYPKWPDARKIDRPLRTLRNKNLISGTPKSFYSLTKPGKQLALKIYELLRQKRLELRS